MSISDNLCVQHVIQHTPNPLLDPTQLEGSMMYQMQEEVGLFITCNITQTEFTEFCAEVNVLNYIAGESMCANQQGAWAIARKCFCSSCER
jgi:hypothetical protein